MRSALVLALLLSGCASFDKTPLISNRQCRPVMTFCSKHEEMTGVFIDEEGFVKAICCPEVNYFGD